MSVRAARLYRRKSEVLDPRQLWLFDREELGQPLPPDPPDDPSEPPKRRRKGHGRKRFPDHLQRVRIDVDVDEKERICPDCGKAMCAFGEEVSERGHVIPAQIVVHQYVRTKYACPDGHAVKTATLPATVVDKGKYEPSVYSYVAVAKFGDHLPLHHCGIACFRLFDASIPHSQGITTPGHFARR